MGIGGLANLLLNILLVFYNQDIEYHIFLREYSWLIYCNEEFPCYTFFNLCHEKRSLEFGVKTHKVIFNATTFQREKDLERIII